MILTEVTFNISDSCLTEMEWGSSIEGALGWTAAGFSTGAGAFTTGSGGAASGLGLFTFGTAKLL
jgi:hypothetical protein